MGLFQRVLRAGEGKKLKAVQAVVEPVNAWEPDIQKLSDDQLQAKTAEFKGRVERGETLGQLLPEAFAVVRESASRVLRQRHYDVQLMGGAALHFGWVAEMRTGEGKTLVSTLPAYLNALTGKGVHLVTVNDYLAERDADWMGQLHRWLGLTVGLIVPGQRDSAIKRENYACDITYGTNNEMGFDYLRDNMARTLDAMVQRGHNFAIVDEVDSILIDEARTPLIISGKLSDQVTLYQEFARVARMLRPDEHYEVDEKKRTIVPTEEGIAAVEAALGVDNLYNNVNQNLVHQLQAALKAKELFHRDKDYIVTAGEVKIVDEFTGRTLEGRRWSEGLHQAVEAKEGVAVKEENQTLATITLQNYFRLYDKLAGMTGTAETEAAEFKHTYDLEVVAIPTNQPVVRDDSPDVIFKSELAKFNAIAQDIEDRHNLGQPILVGTGSVENSEKLSRVLRKRGISHEVLNAKQHHREAEIIAQAGRPGAVTVATNMAGRGVDILLGGNPEGLARRDLAGQELEDEEYDRLFAERVAAHAAECKTMGKEVRENLGGLYVIGTERHDSRRIDNQLRGRAGRQGDPGASRFYLSLEDDLMRLFATGAMEWVMSRALPDDEPIEAKSVSKAIARAQGSVEEQNFERRKNVLKYDEVMNEQRRIIYRRRQQVLQGEDLRDTTLETLEDVITRAVDTYVPDNDDADFPELLVAIQSYFPTTVTLDQLEGVGSKRKQLVELLNADAIRVYEAKEEQFGSERLRDIERYVMLSVIDQHWREHLYEMDYLQGGINLRAMGQKDPLTEWQREGYDMFEAMLAGIDDDFIKYVFRIEAKKEEPQAQPRNVQYSAPASENRPVTAALAPGPSAAAQQAGVPQAVAATATVQRTIRNADEKQGRNDPCACGSGKKYKQCCGRV
jgi:preprotein translocase subunit SecA